MTETLPMWPVKPGGERVMIVDDDPAIREGVGDLLEAQGYAVDVAANGPQMDRALVRRPADLVLLDLLLPGEDGLSVCRRLARPGGPAIIMFSTLADEVDRIVGYEVGADHYLPKPCAPRELLAWVRAVLRRRRRTIGDRQPTPAYAFAGWRLDPIQLTLTSPDGADVDISSGLLELLRTFVEHPGRLVSCNEFAALDRSRDLCDHAKHRRISRLRDILGRNSNSEGFIRTVRGQGYLFTETVTRVS